MSGEAPGRVGCGIGGTASQPNRGKIPGFSPVWWMPPQKRTLTPKRYGVRGHFDPTTGKGDSGRMRLREKGNLFCSLRFLLYSPLMLRSAQVRSKQEITNTADSNHED